MRLGRLYSACTLKSQIIVHLTMSSDKVPVKPVCSHRTKVKLLEILCTELNEELEVIQKTKAAQLKNQKAIRVRSIKSKRNENTNVLPSKRFKTLQSETRLYSSRKSSRVDPFARRKARENPAKIFHKRREGVDPSATGYKTETRVRKAIPTAPRDKIDDRPTQDQSTNSNHNSRVSDKQPIYSQKPITNDMTQEAVHKLVVNKLVEACRVNIKKGWGKSLSKICIEIANKLAEGFDGCKSNQYRNRLRTILFNIRRNPELCKKLLSHQISPADLALKLSALEMASSKKQLEIKKKMQEIEKSSTITDDGLPWSDDKIKCTHCDERGCVVSYSIEASVNSKVNIWGGASNDISGTQYKCKKCGHRWKSDN